MSAIGARVFSFEHIAPATKLYSTQVVVAECWLELAPPRLATSFMQTRDKKDAIPIDVPIRLVSRHGRRMSSDALNSTNAVIRARHIKDRDNWREIAASIAAAEKAIKQRKGK